MDRSKPIKCFGPCRGSSSSEVLPAKFKADYPQIELRSKVMAQSVIDTASSSFQKSSTLEIGNIVIKNLIPIHRFISGLVNVNFSEVGVRYQILMHKKIDTVDLGGRFSCSTISKNSYPSILHTNRTAHLRIKRIKSWTMSTLISTHQKRKNLRNVRIFLPRLALKLVDTIETVLRHHFHGDWQLLICELLELWQEDREFSAVFEVELRRGLKRLWPAQQ